MMKSLKCAKRRAQRFYQKNRNEHSLNAYKEKLKAFNKARDRARMHCNKEKVDLAKGDLKQTYRVVNSLVTSDSSPSLPSCTSDELLANDFGSYFTDKIKNIRNGLDEENNMIDSTVPECSNVTSSFNVFKPIEKEEVVKLVKSMKSKQCPDDPIPTWLVKECVNELSHVLTLIINSSLQSGYFPDALKHASVRPLIKDQNGDIDDKKNYRPISNLTFVSKLLEKAALVQINEHINSESLHCAFQSGYRPHHSCETSVFKLTYDIQEAINDRKMVGALFLDMSAAFDTVDHNVLLKRLSSDFGFGDNVLAWLESYMTNRKFSVLINNCRSRTFYVLFGVPQGSILGPLLFILYTKQLSAIASKHGLNIQLYADDTTLYISFRPLAERNEAFNHINDCLDEIKLFLTRSFLKLNTSKTVTTFFWFEVLHVRFQ